jgi:hypothetical protein
MAGKVSMRNLETLPKPLDRERQWLVSEVGHVTGTSGQCSASEGDHVSILGDQQ